MDDILWPTLAERHVEGIEQQAGMQAIGPGAAGDVPTAGGEHLGETMEPRRGQDAGIVVNPRAATRQFAFRLDATEAVTGMRITGQG